MFDHQIIQISKTVFLPFAGSLHYSPSRQYQRDPVVLHQGRVPVEQVPNYPLDSFAADYTSTDDSSSNSRSSITSTTDSSQQSLPQASWAPHVRDLISPYSHFSGVSSGYGSRNTSQSTASRDHINSIPNLSEVPLHIERADSPSSDYNIPYVHQGDEESQDEYVSSPVHLETDLMSALQRYYEDPPEITVPRDRNYDVQSEKLANMEARCAELKKEMQEFQRQQSQTSPTSPSSRGRPPRSLSSV